MQKAQQLIRRVFGTTELTYDDQVHCVALLHTLCKSFNLWEHKEDTDDYKFFSHLLVAMTALSFEHFLLNLLPSAEAATFLDVQVQPANRSGRRRKKATKNLKSTRKGVALITHKTTDKKKQRGPTMPASYDQPFKRYGYFEERVGGLDITEERCAEVTKGVDSQSASVMSWLVGCRTCVVMATAHINKKIFATVFEGYENPPLKLKSHRIPLEAEDRSNTSQRRLQHVLDTRTKENFPMLCQSLRVLLDLTFHDFDPSNPQWHGIEFYVSLGEYSQKHENQPAFYVLNDSLRIFRDVDQDVLSSYFTVDAQALQEWAGMQCWEPLYDEECRGTNPLFSQILTMVFLKYREIRSKSVAEI